MEDAWEEMDKGMKGVGGEVQRSENLSILNGRSEAGKRRTLKKADYSATQSGPERGAPVCPGCGPKRNHRLHDRQQGMRIKHEGDRPRRANDHDRRSGRGRCGRNGIHV